MSELTDEKFESSQPKRQETKEGVPKTLEFVFLIVDALWHQL
jgi:hypothetical protein